MNKWGHRAEHWETQGLCYMILSYLVQLDYPRLSTGLCLYGWFCFAGALAALIKARSTD